MEGIDCNLNKFSEFATKFKELSLVYCLFDTIAKGAWFVDSGASCHMTRSQELFTSISRVTQSYMWNLGTMLGVQ